MLVSAGFVFPVLSRKQATEVCHRKLYIKGSNKLDRIHYGDVGDSKNTSLSEERRCVCFDLYKDLIPYKVAWSWQKAAVKKRHTSIDKDKDQSDMLIILQHPPVYTLGTGSLEKFLNFDIQNAPYELYRTERGGEVTYHGPGQLVMYPILNLRSHKMDLHWNLKSLEEVVIRALSITFSIKASRIEGLTGVWIENKKLAAVGIRVSRWITYHVLALNVTTDLAPFQHIVPCGIHDREVGTLTELLLGSVKNEEAVMWDLMDVTHDSLLKEFSKIFHVSHELKADIPACYVYPILNLRSHKMDLHRYLRSLEEVVIWALSTTFSMKASRIEGLPGVWFAADCYKTVPCY